MAQNNHTPFLKKMLIDFMTEPDPLYAMLEWLTNELMKLKSFKTKLELTRENIVQPEPPISLEPESDGLIRG